MGRAMRLKKSWFFVAMAASLVLGTSATGAGCWRRCSGLENLNLSGKWIHPDSFKDDYVSERLRLQLWTLRFE